MEYRFYEILIMFAVYSVLGYALTIIYKNLVPDSNIRAGVAAGPFCISYGLGAVLIILLTGSMSRNPVFIFLYGAIVGTIIELTAGKITGHLSRWKKKFYKFYHTILWGLLAVLLVLHWNHVLISFVRYLPPWANMVMLLLIYINMTDELLDGVFRLKDRGMKRRSESSDIKRSGY